MNKETSVKRFCNDLRKSFNIVKIENENIYISYNVKGLSKVYVP